MNKKRPTTTSLQNFVAEFDGSQRAEMQRELDYYDFLTTFKAARKNIPLTQEELARKSGVNRTTLSKIESGSRNATVDTLMRLAAALQMRFTIRLSA